MLEDARPAATQCRRCSTPSVPKRRSARSAACSSPSGGVTPKPPRGEPPAHAITVRQTGRMTLGARGDGTRAIHAGQPVAADGRPLVGSPVFGSTYHLTGEPAGPYQYGPVTNPTWTTWEAALGRTRGRRGRLVRVRNRCGVSGFAVLPATRGRPCDGRGVLLRHPPSCDRAARRHRCASAFSAGRRGEPSSPWRDACVADRARAIPKLDVCDISLLSAAAHAAGALIAVDNTTATALGQQPLALGADYSVASDTKALTGHSDLVLGHVACRDTARAEAVRTWRSSTGAVPGVFEAWLAHRSPMTLDLRMARQATNALAVAELLPAH